MDDNLCLTHGYPPWLDPNWSSFTQSNKELGRIWVKKTKKKKKKLETGPRFGKNLARTRLAYI